MKSGHILRWTNRRFVCAVCKVGRGPFSLGSWCDSGVCPGPPTGRAAPAARMNALVQKEYPKPLTRSTQRVVDTVVPLLKGLEQHMICRAEHLASVQATVDSAGLAPSASGSVALATSLGFHPSHHIRTCGVFSWCCHCGRYTSGSKVMKLAEPCTPASAWGRQVLLKIRAGKPPHGRIWGDARLDPSPAPAPEKS